MSNIQSCISCKACFVQSKFEVDTPIIIEVYIRSTCPNDLQFSYLSITVNASSYTSEFAVGEGNTVHNHAPNPSLEFKCNEIKKFFLEFMPKIQDVGQEIQIGNISLHLGNKNTRCAILRFNDSNNGDQYPELSHFRIFSNNIVDYDNIRHLSKTAVIPRLSKVNVEVMHNQPALIGEWYQIDIDVFNAEVFDISKIEIKVCLEIDEIGSELASKFTHIYKKKSFNSFK